MKKVSVIIPVYNSELFIRQCIQSVIAQTYHEWEVILVDDGSADQSRNLCEEFCLADRRIKIFTQEHKGVSSARNYGMERAEGEYIFFLDSDDAIHPFLIEELVRKSEAYQASLAFCVCKKMESAQMDELISAVPQKTEVLWEIGEETDSEEWFHSRYDREMSRIGGKLIRRSAVEKLRFDESLHIGEDTVFMYFLVCNMIKIVYCQMEWYYYRIHPNSTLRQNMINVDKGDFRAIQVIRDAEYQKEHYAKAYELRWSVWRRMKSMYLLLKSAGDTEEISKLEKLMVAEAKNSMSWKL